MKCLAAITFLSRRVWRRLKMYLYRPLFGSHGRGFLFDPDGYYSFENVYVGDDVKMAVRPTLMAAKSEIRIGNKVMMGPDVTLIGGNHNTREVGSFMLDVTEKGPNDDLGIIVEDDVWIGARAVILRGVTIGRGGIIGAGSLVNRSTPPYAIVAGNPARVLSFRWDVETILRHEKALYPEGERLNQEDLERWQKEMSMLPPKRVNS